FVAGARARERRASFPAARPASAGQPLFERVRQLALGDEAEHPSLPLEGVKLALERVFGAWSGDAGARGPRVAHPGEHDRPEASEKLLARVVQARPSAGMSNLRTT